MRLQQIRLLDARAPGSRRRPAGRRTRGARSTFGVSRARPAVASSMAVKMGFRTQAKSPRVTSAVRSPASTPMRHESPMPSCAQRVSGDARRTEHDAHRVNDGAVERRDRLDQPGELQRGRRGRGQQRHHEEHGARTLGGARDRRRPTKPGPARAAQVNDRRAVRRRSGGRGRIRRARCGAWAFVSFTTRYTSNYSDSVLGFPGMKTRARPDRLRATKTAAPSPFAHHRRGHRAGGGSGFRRARLRCHHHESHRRARRRVDRVALRILPEQGRAARGAHGGASG